MRNDTTRHTTRDASNETGRAGALVRVLLGALVLLTMTAPAGCTPEQVDVHRLVNDERRQAGLPDLLPSPHAATKAQAWAEELARSGTLRHSRLSDGLPRGWRRLTENVGRGPDLESIHRAFMDSPSHRANILDPAVTWMGTGHAVSVTGVTYVAVVFASW